MEGIGANWDEIYTEGQNFPGKNPPLRLFKYVSPGFFGTAGTRIVAGRDITWTDVYGFRLVVVLSENLARELWGTPSSSDRRTNPRISEHAVA
jgi:hypothetical protein